MSSSANISFPVVSQTHASRAERSSVSPRPSKAELTASEKKEVAELKEQDADVRRHEQAHLAAAGPYGKGSPTYDYKKGPDGKQYAVGGHVDIDTSEVKGDPQATLEKARVIQRAALAPQEPSDQDQKVAREAEQMAQKAEGDLRKQKAEEANVVAQGYDRHGSPVYRSTARARLNVVV